MIRLVLTLLYFFYLPFYATSAEVRTWTNDSGQSLQAEYLSHADGKVKIRRIQDRQVFEIAIATLSSEDQEWLKALTQSAQGGIYIAAGHGGHRMSSLDGVTWKNHEFWDKPAHNQNDLKAIAAGNGVCVVVGGFSKSNILVTTDGVNWEKNPFNMGVLSGVIFVDDRFLIFGEGGKVGESKDGTEWTIIGDANVRAYREVEMARLGLDTLKLNIRAWRHADGVFVGAGDNSIIVSTRDFQEWHFAERKEPLSRLRPETNGEGFVVKGDRTLAYSPDGIEWSFVTPELDEKTRFGNLVYDGERYIVNTRGDASLAWESKDGQSWSQVKGQTFPNTIAAVRPDLYYSFQIYWKYTEDLLYSTDQGRSWESATIPAPTGITCVVHAGGIPAFP